MDIHTQLTDAAIEGAERVDNATRGLLSALARAANSGKLDNAQARAGAAAVSMALLEECTEAMIPNEQFAYEVLVANSQTVDDFLGAIKS